MATKLKRRRPWLTLGAFVIAVSVLFVAAAFGLVLDRSGRVALDYKKTQSFQGEIGMLVEQTEQALYDGYGLGYLDEESGNIACYARRGETVAGFETEADSTDAFIEEVRAKLLTNNNDYDYLVSIRDGKVYEAAIIRGERTEITRTVQASSFSRHLTGNALDMEISIAVRAPSKMVNYGGLYQAYYRWYTASLTACIVLGAAGLALLTLLIVLIKHKSLRIAEEALAAGMGKVWMEVKLLLTAAVILGVSRIFSGMGVSDLQHLGGFELLLIWSAFWWCWLVLVDLFINRKQFFAHNSLVSAARFYRGLESRYEWLARMKRRPVFLAVAEVLLGAVCMVMAYHFGSWGEDWTTLIAGGCVAFGVALFVFYLRRYHQNMDDFAKIIDYVDGIKNGDAAEPLHLQSDFAPLAENLNQIHSGISRAVEEQVRSEKMKSELVTNVSHDLKTPLTSIINYVDLLGQEELQPDYANDYVKILEQKAARLKILVQDLFEISKVNSGSADLNPELLDVSALVEQTVAEMDERADRAGVEVKIQLSSERLPVCADGKKLHRVFENLLGNALKYSLAGTRVYITVGRNQDVAEVAFKNVSNYEMTFTTDDIVERFQRGDASRATEGSGLGLAIAKSFVEINGGTLRIELDGDLFKAIVSLPLSYEKLVFTEEPETETVPETHAEEAAPVQETAPEAAEPEMESALSAGTGE